MLHVILPTLPGYCHACIFFLGTALSTFLFTLLKWLLFTCTVCTRMIVFVSMCREQRVEYTTIQLWCLPPHISHLLESPNDIPSTVSKQQLLFEPASETFLPSQEVEVQHCWQSPSIVEKPQLQQWIRESNHFHNLKCLSMYLYSTHHRGGSLPFHDLRASNNWEGFTAQALVINILHPIGKGKTIPSPLLGLLGNCDVKAVRLSSTIYARFLRNRILSDVILAYEEILPESLIHTRIGREASCIL